MIDQVESYFTSFICWCLGSYLLQEITLFTLNCKINLALTVTRAICDDVSVK